MSQWQAWCVMFHGEIEELKNSEDPPGPLLAALGAWLRSKADEGDAICRRRIAMGRWPEMTPLQREHMGHRAAWVSSVGSDVEYPMGTD
jgi:hypothetical protein